MEEYESDELAHDSEDEKKLRTAEQRAMTKIKQKSANPRGSTLSNAPKSRDFKATLVPEPFASAVSFPNVLIRFAQTNVNYLPLK